MTAMFIAERKDNMEEQMISDEKLEYLKKAGLTDDEIDDANSFGKEQSEKFSGRARKEADAEASEQESQDQDVVDEEKDNDAKNADTESEKADGDNSEETEKSEEEQEKSDNEENSIDADLVKSVVKQALEEFGTVVAETFERIDGRLKGLEKEVKSASEREKQKELEPLSTTLVSRLRAVGSKEAELDNDDETLKDKPDEAEEDEKSLGEYSNASDLLMDIFGGK